MNGALLLDRLPSLRGRVTCGRGAPPAAEAGRGWELADLAGRLVELSGQGDSVALTLAVQMVAKAHRRGENVAWISTADPLFPPDAAAAGVDLAALPVVQLPAPPPRHKPRDPRPTRGSGARGRDGGAIAARAALHLLRAGCFALVVLDLGTVVLPPAPAALLAHLARRHGTALLCLTHKGEATPCLSPLVSLRLHSRRGDGEEGRFPCHLTALRDRRHGPGWRHVERCRGPAGLC